MKKILPIILSLSALSAAALPLSPEQALQRLNTGRHAPALRLAATGGPEFVDSISVAGLPAVYLFHSDDNMLVVSAESETTPLLGLTDSFAPGDKMPPALAYMLDCYAREIEALRNNEVITRAAAQSTDDRPAIAPICKTRWDQSEPYNADCPQLNGQPTMTGCVATAMAQVLKTYEFPQKCSGGLFAYVWNTGGKTLTLNYSNLTFDWNAMENYYSPSQSAPEVAKLMKALGYSARMDYSPSSSGASSRDLAEGLVRNFGFDCTLNYCLRQWYSLAQWQTMIYDVLADGHAVFYDGINADFSSAHAFVVDGYLSDGLFHINWGWSGLSDGYFRLSALDPDSQGIGGSSAGYNGMQGAILGLDPESKTSHSDAPLHYFTPDPFKAVGSYAKLGDEVSFEGGLCNNGPLLTTQMAPSIKLLASDGEASYVESSRTYSNVSILAGVGSWSVKIPRNLKNGIYTIHPAVKGFSDNKFYDSMTDIGGDGYVIAEVEDGYIYFENRESATITCTEMTFPDEVYPATPFYLSASFANQSPDIFTGSVFAYIFPKGSAATLSQALGYIGAFHVELEPGESTSSTVLLSFPDAELGEYQIALFDEENRRISDLMPINLVARPPVGTPSCTAISVLCAEQDNLKFKLDLTCSGGLYSRNIYVIISSTTSSQHIDFYSYGPVLMNEGDTQTVTISGAFLQGTPGKRYRAWAYYHNGTNIIPTSPQKYVTFTLEAPNDSSIDNIDDDSTLPIEYFDLAGRRVDNPSHGIYIRRQGNEIEKVIL